jgi:transposase-like protein
MSKNTQRKFTPQFKFNLVLESFVTSNVSGTASRHGVHITQLNLWRKKLKTQGPEIYETSRAYKNEYHRELDQLEKIIGRLTIENQVLKKTQEMLA